VPDSTNTSYYVYKKNEVFFEIVISQNLEKKKKNLKKNLQDWSMLAKNIEYIYNIYLFIVSL
jgi:hypothetical protein